MRDTKKNKLRKVTTKNTKSFARYIYKVLKTVHHGLGISKKSMKIMNSIVCDVFERLSSAGAHFTRIEKRKTLSWRDI